MQVSTYVSNYIVASFDPSVSVNNEGKITDANELMATITGISLHKLLGTDLNGYFIQPNISFDIYNEVCEKGSISNYHLTLLQSEGEQREVLVNGIEYKNTDDDISCVFVTIRDITEQKTIDNELGKYKHFFNNIPDFACIANMDGYFEATNLNFENILGYTSKELTENKFLYFVHPDDQNSTLQEIESLKSGLLTTNFANRYRKKDGTYLWLDWNTTPNLTTGYLYAVARDITSQKVLSKHSLSLIEASHDPLVTINIQGKITDVNQATVNITGIVRENLIGTDFFGYFTEPQNAREVYQEVFAKGSVADSPLTVRHKDGKLTDVLFNGSVYKDDKGNVLGVVIVARDVTYQKRIARELTEAKIFAEFATVVAEEAKCKAENATQIAEDAVKAKQNFLSNMSHEIRTPMNAIIGFTKVLSKTDLSVQQKEYLHIIKMSGDSLIVLINDILDLAKVDAGKMRFESSPFSMPTSISSMTNLLEIKIHEKNLELVLEYDKRIPNVLVGDSARLHQIILNLLSNAIKFTTYGSITISLLLLDEDDQKATIKFAIKDTGIGIDEDKLNLIFENFHQATSGTNRMYGGTGLGLAIVKQLVELQGGSITVSSELNKGSTFSFVMSFLKTQEEVKADEETVKIDTEIKHLHILVVEDIEFNQMLIKALLDEFGFKCDFADNGKIAIEKLKNSIYDVILMDLQMPVMNGFEATEYIRNTMKSNVTIIALTADVTTTDLAKCKEAGMNDYISKPINERVLYNKLEVLARKSPSLQFNTKQVYKHSKNDKVKKIDLTYLHHCTRSNPVLMIKIISAYLKRIPMLINDMKTSLENNDWALLESSAHNMIPSFAMVGISSEYENMSRKIQEYSNGTMAQKEKIPDMIHQIASVCEGAYTELEEEINLLNNTNTN